LATIIPADCFKKDQDVLAAIKIFGLEALADEI